ncbi:hypothetical protein [Streptomyces sp. NPDC057702]|uniref:hypothetical protein n=1 Tax=unclassified Streptomyces TaxID=2593676 RepID=UPI0036CD341E
MLNPRLLDWCAKLAKERVGDAIGELLSGALSPAEAVRAIQRAADVVAKDATTHRRRHA